MSDTTASTAAAETIDWTKPVQLILSDGDLIPVEAALVNGFRILVRRNFCNEPSFWWLDDGEIRRANSSATRLRIRNVPSPASPEPEAKAATYAGKLFSRRDMRDMRWFVDCGKVRCAYHDNISSACDSDYYPDIAAFERAIASGELVPVDPAPTVEKDKPRQTFDHEALKKALNVDLPDVRIAVQRIMDEVGKVAYRLASIADAYEASQGKE